MTDSPEKQPPAPHDPLAPQRRRHWGFLHHDPKEPAGRWDHPLLGVAAQFAGLVLHVSGKSLDRESVLNEFSWIAFIAPAVVLICCGSRVAARAALWTIAASVPVVVLVVFLIAPLIAALFG